MDKPEITLTPELLQYEKKVYDQRQLIELSKALNSQLDLQDLIDSILNSCLAHLHTFHAGLLLKDKDQDDDLVLHHEYKGFDIEHPSEIRVSLDSPLAEHFRRQPKAVTWKTLSADQEHEKECANLRGLKLNLLVPLLARGELTGILLLGEKATGGDYIGSEIGFLEEIAQLAGIATNNARLYELATTDMMTKLKMHHIFQSSLRDTMKRARRDKTPLSIFMTDIDHFKKFNDTYGHQAGNVVLQAVARILAETVRRHDVAARYGGEEFCAILPNTTLEEAELIAERVRQRVEDARVDWREGEPPFQVKLSAGVATFDPATDAGNHELIEKADQALYRAKKNGRNRCESFREPAVIDG